MVDFQFCWVGEERRQRSLSRDDRVWSNKNKGKGSAALVYGQMNEPPGARARVSINRITKRSILETKKGKTFFCRQYF